MKRLKQKRPYFLLLCAMHLYFFSFQAQAQTVASNVSPLLSHPIQDQSQDLSSVLRNLSERFSTVFNYDKETISDRKVSEKLLKRIAEQEDLESTLESLLRPLGLGYKRFEDASYAIFPQVERKGIKKLERSSSEEASSLNTIPQESKETAHVTQMSPRRIVSSRPQQQTISGKVTDEDSGEPLPGVNILAKGTTQGTVSDIEGNYRISIEDEIGTLVFSSIGYLSKEVPINGRSVINITMSPDVKSLSEVVVIGYGTQQKSDMTGSVGSVDKEVFQQLAPTNIQQGLAGRVAGVNVTQNSGRPGGRPTIRIRGNSSVTGPNEPLYVVDGVILPVTSLSNGTSPIDFLDPGNIESIEVLKDASATAIYGARAANGVILVTTRGQKFEGGRITYDGSFSAGVLPAKIDLLNSEQFLRLEELAYQNAAKYGRAGSAIDPATKRNDPRLFDSSGNPLYDTDWQEEGFRTAISNRHNLSFSGGDSKSSYAFNLGYRNEEGILKTSALERYTGRLMIDSQIRDWLTIGTSLNYSAQNESQPRAVGSGGITPTRSILQAPPIIPVRYPDGSFGRTLDYPGMEGGAQPVRLVNETKRLLNAVNTIGNAYANIKIAEGLEFKSTIGINLIEQEVKYYAGDQLQFISENGTASISDEKHTSWQFENYLTYQKEIAENHSFNGLLGGSWQRVTNFSKSVAAENFLDNYFEFNNLGSAANPRPPASNANAYSLNSYFARINYSMNNRYLFTFTGRMDGASRFSDENKYAFFPSGALGWRISEESFMQNVSLISNLKLRTSYGLTGNSEIPNYLTVAGLGNYSYIINGERVPGIGIQRMANSDLRWEKSSQFDIGIEIGLLEDRISLEGDVYYKKTEDMLLNAPVPASSGFSNVTQNIGSMENSGIELSLTSTNVINPNFRWTTAFNISMNRNRVISLTGGQDIIQGGNPVTGNRIIREGEAVNSFYGFVQLGTWNTEEADQASRYNRLPGDIKYQDINNDGTINDQDRVIVGNGLPDGFGALINTFNYKNFEVVVDVQFMYGNDVAFGTKSTSLDRTGITNVFSEVLNAWTPDNQDTFVPEVRPTAAYRDRQTSSGRIYDGSFLRGRNILLAYNFPSNKIGKWGLSNVRIQASVQNFFLITDYPGYDPEVSSLTENFSQGVDLYSYPKPRVFQLGLSCTL